MTKTIKTFGKLQRGEQFMFRFGSKGERGLCRKISPSRYIFVADEFTWKHKVFSVAVKSIEVVV